MRRFLHSVAVQEQAISADGLQTFDLPVNPLSVILLCLRPLNDTGTLANFQNYRGIAAAMNRVSVTYQGAAIVSMRGEDLAALNWFRHGMIPFQVQHDNVDNERRCTVVPILLGKFPYDPVSCFPATRRGELQLEIDFDIADTGYDGMRFSCETVELLEAKPREFERKIQIAQMFAATGDNDMDLPATGNLFRGVLLFGTTSFGGAAPAPSWGRVKTMLDNQEVGYAGTDFEVAAMLSNLWGRLPPLDDHKHTLNAAGAGVEETTSTFDIGENWNNYCFLDFDPTRDDMFSLDTKGKTMWRLRADAETADAVRAIPIEVVKV